uniref:Uncharacterized protein n=1 Tax=Lepeophtheirus salmonis TaxID=72036 RepID=A0A0K2T3Z1_LEPSM
MFILPLGSLYKGALHS